MTKHLAVNTVLHNCAACDGQLNTVVRPAVGIPFSDFSYISDNSLE